MPDTARRIVAFLIALGVFALDRWSKWMVETQFTNIDSKTVIPGFFNIVRAQNPGVAFGIFAENASQSRTPILIGLSVLAVLLLAGMLWRIERLDTPSAIGLALIFGGSPWVTCSTAYVWEASRIFSTFTPGLTTGTLSTWRMRPSVQEPVC